MLKSLVFLNLKKHKRVQEAVRLHVATRGVQVGEVDGRETAPEHHKRRPGFTSHCGYNPPLTLLACFSRLTLNHSVAFILHNYNPSLTCTSGGLY